VNGAVLAVLSDPSALSGLFFGDVLSWLISVTCHASFDARPAGEGQAGAGLVGVVASSFPALGLEPVSAVREQWFRSRCCLCR
jgi:hypothetical protein